MKHITTPAALIEAALNPNLVPIVATSDLLAGAVEQLESEYDAASKSGGQELVRRVRQMRAAAERLSTVSTDNTSRATRMQAKLARLAAANSDQHIQWLMAASVMTPEQHATVRAAFA
jgi:hypothetical protein